jgi:hypothetical protein
MSDPTPASSTPDIVAPAPAHSLPMPQNATECTISATRDSHLPTPAQITTRGLSERHRIAIDMILAGEDDHAVCFRLKIDRSTLYRWKHHNPHFIAEMNRRRQEIWSDFTGDLRLSIAKAIRALDNQLENPNPVTQHRAARTMLSLVNSDRISPKNAPTRLEDVLDHFLRAAQPLPTDPAPKNAPPPTFTDAQRQALLDRLLAEDSAAESARQAAAAERSTLYHQRRQYRQPAPSPAMDNGQSTMDNGQLTTDQ